jgi:membrane protease YdiL (CAAX protease family)
MSTYNGSFASADSTTLIVTNSVALTEEVIFTGFLLESQVM